MVADKFTNEAASDEKEVTTHYAQPIPITTLVQLPQYL
jgi:hypothetical protein